MNQGDESPLFCREDTPPRSGVPPGYVSVRHPLLQRQQSPSIQHVQRDTESEDEAFRNPGKIDAAAEEDDGTSSSLVNLTNDFDIDAIDVASIATESDSVQNTSLSMIHDQATSPSNHKSEDAARDEKQASPAHSFSESLKPPFEEYEQTAKLPSLSVEVSVMRVLSFVERTLHLVVEYLLVISP
ncbi:hypothetical protein KCU77_g126, partial [Aureobasidium melanogenum]